MSLPFTIRSIPIWNANDTGFYNAFIKSLSCLASFAASLIEALH